MKLVRAGFDQGQDLLLRGNFRYMIYVRRGLGRRKKTLVLAGLAGNAVVVWHLFGFGNREIAMLAASNTMHDGIGMGFHGKLLTSTVRV